MTRYLLDTHVAIWWADDSPRLSPVHKALIEDGGNDIYLSAVSVWEAAIKAAQGKLTLPVAPLQFFQRLLDSCQFLPLPVHFSHAAQVYSLPKVHADPFDRLLISQARRGEKLALMSDDTIFTRYELPGLVTR